jgi:hypothetical protein
VSGAAALPPRPLHHDPAALRRGRRDTDPRGVTALRQAAGRATTDARSAQSGPSPVTLAVALWAIGALIVTARLAAALLAARRVVRAAAPLEDMERLAWVESVAREAGGTRSRPRLGPGGHAGRRRGLRARGPDALGATRDGLPGHRRRSRWSRGRWPRASARVEDVRVAGKTGTAEEADASGKVARYASFVGIVPSDRPRFVILVGAQVPGRDDAVGGSVAAPAFAQVAARALGR